MTSGIDRSPQSAGRVELEVEKLQIYCSHSACEGMHFLAANVVSDKLRSITLSQFVEFNEFTWDLRGVDAITFHDVNANEATLLVSPLADLTISDSNLKAVLVSRPVADGAP
jgi:hypothetical protein